jgi:hypothetical protein
MAAAIVHGDGVPDHLREDSAGARPGANDFFIARLIHHFDSLQQLGLNERPFLE